MTPKIEKQCISLHKDVLSTMSSFIEKNEFKLVHSASKNGTKQCLLIYENEFKIKLIQDRGGLEILLGSREAPNTWKDKSKGRRYWFHSWGIFDWIEGKPKPTPEELNLQNEKDFIKDNSQRLEELTEFLQEYKYVVERIFSEMEHKDNGIALENYMYK